MSADWFWGRRFARRYFQANRSSWFLSLISWISVGGIAVGVTTLVVILSVMGGFEREILKRLYQTEAHVRLELYSGGIPVGEWERPGDSFFVELKALDSRIVGVRPVWQTEVILKGGRRVSGGVLRGIPEEEWNRRYAQSSEKADPVFDAQSPRLLLGQEKALEMGLVAGDEVLLASPAQESGGGAPLGAAPRVKKFSVSSVYKSGLAEQELHEIFVRLKDIESFLRRRNRVSHIEVQLQSLDDSFSVAEKIKTHLTALLPSIYQDGVHVEVRTWQQLNEHLFASLRLERWAMFVALLFIVLVATFNILSLLTMTISRKRRSFAILRAMGAREQQVRSIVFWKGQFMAWVGTLVGIVFGLGVVFVLKSYPVIELPEYYYDRTLPVELQWTWICFIVLASVFIVSVGAGLAVRRMRGCSVIEDLRNPS